MKERTDIYEQITSTIIEAIEQGCEKLEMPWHTCSAMPSNTRTGHRYRGINVLALWAAARRSRFNTNLWATYQQWSEQGAQVRKGTKSTTVLFWKMFGTGENHESEAIEEQDSKTSRWFACAYRVFNADQVDGFTLPDVPQLDEGERIARAEEFFKKTGACVEEVGASAHYDSPADKIYMPCFAYFQKADHFYSTLAHETTHWAGAPSRLNRNLNNRFGSEAYAAEELIAELGAAFLSSELDLATEPRKDHAPYIENWLKVLRSDKRAIFSAASHAQRAVDWIISR